MKATRESRKLAKSLFRACFTGGRYDRDKALQQLKALASAAPRTRLAVLQQFRRFIRLEEAKLAARVETAVVLSDAQCGKIVEQIRKRYGPAISASFSVNPSLLGGIRIRVGSDVWDGSVKGRLDRLNEEFQKA